MTAFSVCEPRSPAQFTDAGFIAVHRDYVATLYAGSPAHRAGLPVEAYDAPLWRIIDSLARLGAYYVVDWARPVMCDDL